MPRPKKKCNVRFQPCIHELSPDGPRCKEHVLLKLEEVESLRLMDLENHDQNSCADMMEVSRSTFQRIYQRAKTKVADAIVNGKKIKIENPDEKVQRCCHSDGDSCK